mmetsp:Transcript_12728/g.27662  ORF Transcript_12728/g.27662 Transcript_12728/m.27662 type:complete len:126 (+) Transcript_12728:254-631(+)
MLTDVDDSESVATTTILLPSTDTFGYVNNPISSFIAFAEILYVHVVGEYDGEKLDDGDAVIGSFVGLMLTEGAVEACATVTRLVTDLSEEIETPTATAAAATTRQMMAKKIRVSFCFHHGGIISA